MNQQFTVNQKDMMQSDNMGGIVSAEFLHQGEINSFVVFKNLCSVSIKNQHNWKFLLSKKDGITINVTADNSNSEIVYEIRGSIILKKESNYINELSLNPLILIKYTTPDGCCRIAGTTQYPLKINLKPLTPSKASEFYGYELSFTGRQLHYPPFINK